MSYNVTDFTIKKLDAFTLPYAKVLEMAEGHVTIADDILTFDEFYASGMEIVGTREGERLTVTSIYYGDEGSGTYWDAFEALLAESTGTLKVRITWEGGDTVEIVTVTDGAIEREDV